MARRDTTCRMSGPRAQNASSTSASSTRRRAWDSVSSGAGIWRSGSAGRSRPYFSQCWYRACFAIWHSQVEIRQLWSNRSRDSQARRKVSWVRSSASPGLRQAETRKR